jgi:hypothetical protein
MKHLFFPFLFVSLVAIGCTKRKISDMEYYGNTFINVSDEEFEAPDDWKRVVLGDGEFEIQMPPYMQQSALPSHVELGVIPPNQAFVFRYTDTTGKREYHYGRISVDFTRDRQFGLATDYLPVNVQYDLWEPIVHGALKGGDHYGVHVPDGKLLNGPHCKIVYSYYPNYIYNVCYRRGGHIKGKGPVSVNVFLLMNKKEAAVITISHHDKDSLLFKDLFNVVKTFRWREIYK